MADRLAEIKLKLTLPLYGHSAIRADTRWLIARVEELERQARDAQEQVAAAGLHGHDAGFAKALDRAAEVAEKWPHPEGPLIAAVIRKKKEQST